MTAGVAGFRHLDAASRVVALDTIRGFAVVAMIVAHAIPFTRAVTPGVVMAGEALLNDVASPVFALVIGATIAFNTRGDQFADRTSRSRFRVQTALKAAALIVLGLALDLAYSGVAVVLDFVGATLLVALPLLFLSTRALLVATATLCIAGPPIIGWASDFTTAVPALAYPPSPATVAIDWLMLDPSYRVLSLLPLLLIGIVIGRWALGRADRDAMLAVGGLVLFAASVPWRELAVASDTYTSGSYPDLLRDVGLSLVAYGSLSLLVDATRGRWRRMFGTLLYPLTAQGEMALSIYVLHVGALMLIWASPLAAPDGAWIGTARGWLLTVALLVGCAMFAITWSRAFGTGPIERLIGVVSLRHQLAFLWSGRPRATDAADGALRSTHG
ncbi:DUF418 domain-containing protein [Agromyces bauzanensis]